jgi:hypothetical protein
MPEILPKLQVYLGAQMPGQGLALEVLQRRFSVRIAKAMVVPRWDSPAGGVLGAMMSS